MNIQRHKKFKKQYKKLPQKWQNRVDETIISFNENPFLKKLQNHSLEGKYKNQRSISVSGDFRLIFEEKDNYVMIMFLEMGTHSQLY